MTRAAWWVAFAALFVWPLAWVAIGLGLAGRRSGGDWQSPVALGAMCAMSQVALVVGWVAMG